MKARVKATGNIIDVSQTESIITSRGVEKQYTDNSDERRTYLRSELEFINEPPQKDIDWEERRYEIARQIMDSQLSCCGYERSMIEPAVKFSVECADALIAELKKGGEK